MIYSIQYSKWESALLWILPGCALVVLGIIRWGHFGDAQVDWGQELAVAWQLSEGKHLYADIAYYRGPFSPYTNALFMQVLGASVRTLMACNLAIASAITYGIFWTVRRATNLPVACTTACAFVLMFVFSEQGYVNTFNYITPFVHELPHGILLALVGLLCMEHALDSKRLHWVLAAGLSFGLALLTRIEISVALTGAILVWAATAWWQSSLSGKTIVNGSAVYILAALFPVCIAIVALHGTMEWHSAVASVFASYVTIFTTSIAGSPFYMFVTGLDDPAAGIFWIGTGTFLFAFWMTNFFLASKRFAAQDPWGACILVILGLSPVLYGTFAYLPPLVHGLVLPVTTIAIGAHVVRTIVRTRAQANVTLRITAVVTVFSLLLLSKIILAPHIRFYGFAHAMPGYLLLISVLLWWVPRHTRAILPERSHLVFVALVSFTVLCDVFAKTWIDRRISDSKILALGTGENRFLVADRPRNVPYAAFLQSAPALIPPGSSLAAIPEGAMMNFILDLPLVTGFTNYLPTDFIIYGKERIEKNLYTHRPDFILLTHKDTSEFGYPLFGATPEYGGDVMQWLEREYKQIALFGEQPLTHLKSEGVALWRRKDFKLPQNPQDVPSLR